MQGGNKASVSLRLLSKILIPGSSCLLQLRCPSSSVCHMSRGGAGQCEEQVRGERQPGAGLPPAGEGRDHGQSDWQSLHQSELSVTPLPASSSNQIVFRSDQIKSMLLTGCAIFFAEMSVSKKDDLLTAVVVADSYNDSFNPITPSTPHCLQSLAGR